jgi:membrane fusion protein, multidrug efflux system
MPITRLPGPEGIPGLIEYSTSTDQAFGEDRDVDDVSRGRSGYPPSPREGDKERTKPDVRPMDSEVMAEPRGTRLFEHGHPVFPKREKTDRHWVRRIVVFSLIAATIGATFYWGIPKIKLVLSTSSTDDAFVSGHTTNISPRIDGVVTEVMIERNDRVEPGSVLLRIDREPYEIALAQSTASLVQARSNLDLANAQVRAQLATARGAYYQRKNAQETLRRQIATLNALFAAIKSNQATVALARNNLRRGEELLPSGAISKEELDQRNNSLKVTIEQEKEAWAGLQQVRAQLGLPSDYKNPLEIPKELENEQSTVQSAVSQIASNLATIGVHFDPKDAVQAKAFGDFLRPDGDKSAGEGLEKVIDDAPAVKVAVAAVTKAERDVDSDRLRLSWTEIKSEVAGYVQDRSANPGNWVQTGQTLVSIRPDYVWVDANFKETQLHYIKIGMPVDLYVDAYPKKVFKGRVSGFLPGTGQSEGLLPPENATGNYIKVTQRLAVRIELVEPNPQDTPLFIGLSVVPYVKHEERANGPDAGKRLHPDDYRQHPDIGGGPAGKQPRNRAEFDSREAGHR